MRKFLTTLLISACIVTLGCSGEKTINGRNDRAAARSLLIIKRSLPSDQRLEFETAFWTLKDARRDNDDFLDTVDGKTAVEIIILGKENFNERRAAGIKAYIKYNSWEDMLVKVKAERAAKPIPKQKMDKRDKANNVLYNLKSM